ncbi:hypothetical protein GCM10027614_26350 [Micromonospora vulcania]
MIALTLAEVAEAVDGRLVAADPTATVTGTVEFDSRKVGPGALFVAFPGEKVDGHDYAATAMAAGAVAVLGSREVPGVPMVLVADALTAMGRLARAAVDRLPDLTVIGLTGSSGKTTTKDLIGQLTSRLGATVAPPGSFNNELGHPYTALLAGPDTRYLVLEKGSRGVGHVRYLCELVPPRISVVLNVGTSHIGEFGSQDTIALAKGELVEALPPDGLAVLNADDPRVDAMAGRTRARVVRFGETPDADVRAEDVTLDDRGARRTPWSPRRARGGAARADRPAPGLQHPRRGGGRPGAGHAVGRAGHRAGRVGVGLHPADGRLRPSGRGDRHRRLVQRQPGVDVGRAEGARRARQRSAYRRGAGLHGRAGPVRAGRPRRGRPTRGRAGCGPAARGGRAGGADPRGRHIGR